MAIILVKEGYQMADGTEEKCLNEVLTIEEILESRDSYTRMKCSK